MERKLKEIREHTSDPVGVGFGIKDATSAAQISRIADAVVVGSALVKRIQENQDRPVLLNTELASVLRPMREAMDEQYSVQQSGTKP